MDDYIRALLQRQLSGMERQPEDMKNSLETREEQSSKRFRQQEHSGEETMSGRLDAPEPPEAVPAKANSGEIWEEAGITALEETAGKRFLSRLEREIAALDREEHTSVILRQQGERTEEKTREEVRIVGQTAVGEQVTPARLSRVFERDARRFQ